MADEALIRYLMYLPLAILIGYTIFMVFIGLAVRFRVRQWKRQDEQMADPEYWAAKEKEWRKEEEEWRKSHPDK